MSSDIHKLKETLEQVIGIDDIVIPAKVKNIDESEFTCECEDMEENTIFDVRLRATIDSEEKSNFCLIPKVGSSVLLSRIGNKSNNYSVINVSEVDKVIVNSLEFSVNSEEKINIGSKEIIFNKGENGGLTIAPKLVEELGKLSARVDGIIDAINNGIPIDKDGGVGLQESIKTTLETLVDKEDFSQIENEKIKH